MTTKIDLFRKIDNALVLQSIWVGISIMRAREGRSFDNVVGLWGEVAVEYHPVFVDELAEVQVLGVG